MSSSFYRILIICGTLVAAGVIIGCLLKAWKAHDGKTFLAIAISITALVFSIWGSWKNELLPCKPAALFSGVLFGRFVPGESSFKIAFPIAFVNEGYGTGVIDNVQLEVTAPDSSAPVRYDPLLEIDLPAFLKESRYLCTETISGPFMPFTLNGKETVVKTLQFVPPNKENMVIALGTYTFRVFASCGGKERLLFTHKFRLDKEVLDDISTNAITVMWLANNTWIRCFPVKKVDAICP